MNRRQGIRILFFLLFCSVTSGGCAPSRNISFLGNQEADQAITVEKAGKIQSETEKTGISSKQEEQEEAAEDAKAGQKTEKMADLSGAMEEILDDAGKEFIGGYLIDESFLMWICAQYGDESVFALQQAVKQEPQEVESWYEITGKSIHVLWVEYCQYTGFQNYALEKVYHQKCADEDKVVMDFTGDINLAEGWSTTEYMDQQPGGIRDCMSDALMQEMQSADILMINNEFTYSTRGTPLEGKDYTFRADPRRVCEIQALGTDVLSLANNHVYDYGEEALLDTLATVEEAGIPYVGAGKNLEDAMKPVYFIANGRKIAIVSATQIERSTNYTKEATETTAGVLKTLDPEKFVSVIEKAKDKSDYVVAFVHWGTEHTSDYGSDQEELGKIFIDAGADVVIGGHTHCLQGFAYYNGKPIIYSLGNFWFNNKTIDTGLSQVIIHTDSNEIDFRFLPCIQQNCVTSLVEEPEGKQRILAFMQSISAPGILVDEEGYVTEVP